jgi:hypothetical protein
MGIFDRSPKKEKQTSAPASSSDGDFNDSPVETVSLSGGAPTGRAGGGPAPATPAPVEEDRPAYGIENAIQLMRALPVDQNVELVVQVIKTTLESLRVKVADIIEDASRKQQNIESRISSLKAAIAEFEKEIAQRKEEIARLEADHAETTAVKARLELAEKAQKSAGAPAAAAASKAR